MKPLLLDILACPICKYYPLKLEILKWETSESKFSKIQEAYKNKDFDYLIKETKIRRGKDHVDNAVSIIENGEIMMKDEMVRTQSNLQNYLKEVELKLENFQVIEDLSEEGYSACLDLIKNEIIKQIIDAKKDITDKKSQKKIIEDLKPNIYLLNWFFQFSEIEEGIIHCEKCSRWYPIIETIPQMLPDDLREKDTEIDFLKKWKAKISKKILEAGKPFNLK